MTAQCTQIKLRDGRSLTYADYGCRDGAPTFYFHGWPGSRLEGQLTEEAAKRRGARIISIDRPGMGLSDFKSGRTILDWPRDVEELADALGLDRFSVVGISAGCPYALAVAAALKERVRSVAVVCGLGPTDNPDGVRGVVGWYRLGLLAARYSPWPVTFLLAGMTRLLLRDPGGAASRRIKSLSQPDRDVLADPHYGRAIYRCALESFRNGIQGPAWDGTLLGRPWGFGLKEITHLVHLWHGESDETIPPAMGRYMAKILPNCRARFVPQEGHLSLPLRRMDEILEALAS